MGKDYDRCRNAFLGLAQTIYAIHFFATRYDKVEAFGLATSIDQLELFLDEAEYIFPSVADSIRRVASLELGAAHDEILSVAHALDLIAALHFPPVFNGIPNSDAEEDFERFRRDWGLKPVYPLEECEAYVKEKGDEFRRAILGSKALKRVSEEWQERMQRRCLAEITQAAALPPAKELSKTTNTAAALEPTDEIALLSGIILRHHFDINNQPKNETSPLNYSDIITEVSAGQSKIDWNKSKLSRLFQKIFGTGGHKTYLEFARHNLHGLHKRLQENIPAVFRTDGNQAISFHEG